MLSLLNILFISFVGTTLKVNAQIKTSYNCENPDRVLTINFIGTSNKFWHLAKVKIESKSNTNIELLTMQARLGQTKDTKNIVYFYPQKTKQNITIDLSLNTNPSQPSAFSSIIYPVIIKNSLYQLKSENTYLCWEK